MNRHFYEPVGDIVMGTVQTPSLSHISHHLQRRDSAGGCWLRAGAGQGVGSRVGSHVAGPGSGCAPCGPATAAGPGWLEPHRGPVLGMLHWAYL